MTRSQISQAVRWTSVAFAVAGMILPAAIIVLPRLLTAGFPQEPCGLMMIAVFAQALIVFVGLFLIASLLEKLAALLKPAAKRETDRNAGGCE